MIKPFLGATKYIEGVLVMGFSSELGGITLIRRFIHEIRKKKDTNKITCKITWKIKPNKKKKYSKLVNYIVTILL